MFGLLFSPPIYTWWNTVHLCFIIKTNFPARGSTWWPKSCRSDFCGCSRRPSSETHLPLNGSHFRKHSRDTWSLTQVRSWWLYWSRRSGWNKQSEKAWPIVRPAGTEICTRGSQSYSIKGQQSCAEQIGWDSHSLRTQFWSAHYRVVHLNFTQELLAKLDFNIRGDLAFFMESTAWLACHLFRHMKLKPERVRCPGCHSTMGRPSGSFLPLTQLWSRIGSKLQPFMLKLPANHVPPHDLDVLGVNSIGLNFCTKTCPKICRHVKLKNIP